MILAVGQEKLGVDDDNLVRVMDVFDGGLGAHGEVCGLVVGGLSVIGLKFGRSKPGSQADMRMWRYSGMFMRRFKEEVTDGRIPCRDIAQVDWTDPDQVRNFRQGGKRDECGILTGKTAKIVGEILERSASE